MKSIRFKITFGIIVILSIILLFLGKITIGEQRKRMMGQMNEYGTETVQFIAKISITPIRKYSIYQLEDYVNQLEKGQLIVFCEIYDLKGNPLAHTAVKKISQTKAKGVGGLLVFKAEINEEGEKLGWVELGLNPQSVIARINKTSLYISLILLVELLLVAFALAFFINRSFVSPILKLSKTTGEIARGKFITSVLHTRKDEVGVLAKSINSMSENLHESYRTLEQKVEERTAELMAAKNASEATTRNLKIVSNELQVLLDNSPVAIMFVTNDRIIQRVNLEFTRLYGYSPQEIMGKSASILFSDEGKLQEARIATDSILGNSESCQKTLEMKKKDGTQITCSLRGRTALLDNESNGVIWTIEDITARLKMEEEVLKVKKLESIGVLAGGIAHDFNNILVSIIGNITLAENFSSDNEKARILLEKSRKASLRAKELTVKLLTFAKGGEPVKSIESLPAIIEESASFVLSGSNVQCHYDIADDLWAIHIDKGQMNQVVQNLILNADQAMPDGGTINIVCRNIVLSGDSGVKEGNYVYMEISDIGQGIPPDVIDNIFDPYFSTKEQAGDRGSGLGLSIVHSIITKHGGSISVKSEQSEGTTFTLYLPATKVKALEPVEVEGEIERGGGCILLMDDDRTIHAVTAEMLIYLGYETLHAYSGDEAIEVYRQALEKNEKIDIVIMDLTIPGGMGGEVAVKKVLELDSTAKVIVSSGYSENPIVQNYRESGFINTISKPYQLRDLSKVLSETMALSPSLLP